MFVTHDCKTKKNFIKPNILKRKTNANVKKTYNINCNSSSKTLMSTSSLQLANINVIKGNSANRYGNSKLLPKVKISGGFQNCHGVLEVKEVTTVGNDHEQPDLVDSYLLGDAVKQDVPVVENVMLSKRTPDLDQSKWMEFINTKSNTIIIEECKFDSVYAEQESDTAAAEMPTAPPASAATANVVRTADINITTLLAVNTDTLQFQCNINDCNKVFSSEQKLRRHRSLHNKDGTLRQPRQTTVACPVKKQRADGPEESCGLIFDVREDLVKHLNETHTLEEAAYECLECGRHFFWASGLRVHMRSHAARRRTLLACAWPGCGRVFHQPCRLREHTRAHTGDKPYPCQHPNCGWSFRTASKLLRHARRHTGERQHVCAACGRAFLRREHLRDHTARHHEPYSRRAHPCTVPDCQQIFTNMSSLYMHRKKVHKQQPSTVPPDASAATLPEHLPKADNHNMFVINLFETSSTMLEEPTKREPEAGISGETGMIVSEEADAAEGHAARTHCTWPLARAPDSFVLEEDVQQLVEQPEGADSNIYTIRSDLFLHGNVIDNDDSEQMDSAAPLDADSLLEAPSVDLAQDELYADVADESSFRVFFLSNEELT